MNMVKLIRSFEVGCSANNQNVKKSLMTSSPSPMNSFVILLLFLLFQRKFDPFVVYWFPKILQTCANYRDVWTITILNK